MQLNADSAYGVAGETINIKLAAVQQSDASIEVKQINGNALEVALLPNTVLNRSLRYLVKDELSSPYWLLKKET